jgi:hypothetical protein
MFAVAEAEVLLLADRRGAKRALTCSSGLALRVRVVDEPISGFSFLHFRSIKYGPVGYYTQTAPSTHLVSPVQSWPPHLSHKGC